MPYECEAGCHKHKDWRIERQEYIEIERRAEYSGEAEDPAIEDITDDELDWTTSELQWSDEFVCGECGEHVKWVEPKKEDEDAK